MQDQVKATPASQGRVPWNKGKLIASFVVVMSLPFGSRMSPQVDTQRIAQRSGKGKQGL
jgi:hypothetical protein